MATWKPELHSADDVLNYYDQYDEPGYSVYAGHKPEQAYCRFTYTGNDKSIGREKLAEALASVQSNPDNTNVYLLQILGSKGKKLETKNAITFQLNKAQQFSPYNAMGYTQNAGLESKINALESRLASLQMQLQENDDDEFEDEPEEENFLAGMMKNPQIQNMIISQLSGLFAPSSKVTHVAGVLDDQEIETDEKINDAIDRLKKCDPELGDDLLLLCEMAENDPMQFKFLLKMLRGK
jgi:hypothetical protein